jgi:hypothetical protein
MRGEFRAAHRRTRHDGRIPAIAPACYSRNPFGRRIARTLRVPC